MGKTYQSPRQRNMILEAAENVNRSLHEMPPQKPELAYPITESG